MILPYSELPADVLVGRVVSRRKVCRTFSERTSAPRIGVVSGCDPRGIFYKGRTEKDLLDNLKKYASAGFTAKTIRQMRKYT
jgi:hypothetical protein